jgi:hypothetical protein
MLDMKRLVDERRFPLWGILGSLIGLVFILIPTFVYVGEEGEAYSIFNHFISELGEIGVSEFAMMFNVGLILAGALFIPFMIGLALYLKNPAAILAGLVGAYSALSIIFVGVYPMNYAPEHSFWALSFFYSGMVMTGIWAVGILLQKTPKVARMLSLGGLINVLVFAAFLSVALSGGTVGVGFRPDFWLVATLEWAVYFAIVGYLLIVSVYVIVLERTRGVSVAADTQQS